MILLVELKSVINSDELPIISQADRFKKNDPTNENSKAQEKATESAVEKLDKAIRALEDIEAPLVIVSDEVGLGIIPNNALARSFIDELGTLNQLISDRADIVVFVTAGLPMYLKG